MYLCIYINKCLYIHIYTVFVYVCNVFSLHLCTIYIYTAFLLGKPTLLGPYLTGDKNAAAAAGAAPPAAQPAGGGMVAPAGVQPVLVNTGQQAAQQPLAAAVPPANQRPLQPPK